MAQRLKKHLKNISRRRSKRTRPRNSSSAEQPELLALVESNQATSADQPSEYLSDDQMSNIPAPSTSNQRERAEPVSPARLIGTIQPCREYTADEPEASDLKRMKATVEGSTQPVNKFVYNAYSAMASSYIPIALQKRGLCIPGAFFSLHGIKLIPVKTWNIHKRENQWILDHLNEIEKDIMRSNAEKFRSIWRDHKNGMKRASLARQQFESAFYAIVAAAEVIVRDSIINRRGRHCIFSMQGRIIPSQTVLKMIAKLNTDPTSLTLMRDDNQIVQIKNVTPTCHPFTDGHESSVEDGKVLNIDSEQSTQLLNQIQIGADVPMLEDDQIIAQGPDDGQKRVESDLEGCSTNVTMDLHENEQSRCETGDTTEEALSFSSNHSESDDTSSDSDCPPGPRCAKIKFKQQQQKQQRSAKRMKSTRHGHATSDSSDSSSTNDHAEESFRGMADDSSTQPNSPEDSFSLVRHQLNQLITQKSKSKSMSEGEAQSSGRKLVLDLLSWKTAFIEMKNIVGKAMDEMYIMKHYVEFFTVWRPLSSIEISRGPNGICTKGQLGPTLTMKLCHGGGVDFKFMLRRLLKAFKEKTVHAHYNEWQQKNFKDTYEGLSVRKKKKINKPNEILLIKLDDRREEPASSLGDLLKFFVSGADDS